MLKKLLAVLTLALGASLAFAGSLTGGIIDTTARSTASAASSTANSASSVAATAQSTANSAQAGVSALTTAVNNTGAGADVTLGVGQAAYIDVSGATTVPLHVATGDNQLFDIRMTLQGGGNTASAVTFNPNNTTYAAAFGHQGYSSSSTGATTTVNGSGESNFVIFTGDVNYCFVTASTKTIAKIISMDCYGDDSNLQDKLNAGAQWSNTTTAWTSLGTLNFPLGVTGRIWIRRQQ